MDSDHRATPAEVLAHVDAGLDPELDKLIEKRRQEVGGSRLDAVNWLLSGNK